VELVNHLEGLAFGDKSIDSYREARKKFVRVYRSQLWRGTRY